MNGRTTTGGRDVSLAGYCHPACVVCGDRNDGGLGLRFEEQADGSVVGLFACEPGYQGYPERLHGGVVAMLLDGAMTNCLFARRVRGFTAKLEVRFRHPVKVGVNATIRARLVHEAPPLYVLEAELLQHDTVRAVAKGKFFGEPETPQQRNPR